MTFIPAIPLTGVAGWQVLRQTEESQREAHDASAEIARETAYFQDNIAKVTSSDELIADRRLLEVALTAYGLEAEIDKGAFIKQVLDGGTENDDSFANRLNDRRWSDFAEAFGFGNVNAGSEVTAFEAAVTLRFRDDSAPAEVIDPLVLAGFRTSLRDVASIDDLLTTPQVLDTALAAFGLERGYYNDDHFRQLLTDGVSDANSYANTVDDGRWRTFAAAFTGLGDGEPLNTITQFELDVERELARRGVGLTDAVTADQSPTLLSSFDIDYLRATASTITSGADLVADDKMMEVVKVAFGLTAETVDNADVAAMVDAAIAGDESLAQAQSNFGWTQLARTIATTVTGGTAARVPEFVREVELSIANNNLEFVPGIDTEPASPPEIAAEELSYFESVADQLTDPADLVADNRALTVALTAFGLEGEGRSTAFIEDILSEDPRDDDSFVNSLSDTRWRDFALAFNPDPESSGSADQWRLELEDRLIALDAPQEDLDYLRQNWNLIDSNLDFVLDPQLLDITYSAFGIEKGRYTSNFFINTVISDPAQRNSFINVLGDDRFKDLAGVLGSFAGRGGNVGLDSFQDTVVSRYESKMFALAVGEQDNSMRLALNFRDEISDIATGSSVETAGWLQLMGDSPLRTVVDTALGLPAEFAQLELTSQVEVYESRISSLYGGRSPAVFTQTDVLNDIIDRFLVAQQSASGTGGGQFSAALSLVQSTAAAAQSVNRTF